MKIIADTDVLVRDVAGDDTRQGKLAQAELAKADLVGVTLPAKKADRPRNFYRRAASTLLHVSWTSEQFLSERTEMGRGVARQDKTRLLSALLAGAIAIALNCLALALADWINLRTAHGGLLRLLSQFSAEPLHQLGIAALWLKAGSPAPNSREFQTAFHIIVGLVMAEFYAVVLEPMMPWNTAIKGLAYLSAVWLLNAFVVLPATGEGVAGSAHLSTAGIVWFAAAHSLFFMTLAYGFAYFDKQLAAQR